MTGQILWYIGISKVIGLGGLVMYLLKKYVSYQYSWRLDRKKKLTKKERTILSKAWKRYLCAYRSLFKLDPTIRCSILNRSVDNDFLNNLNKSDLNDAEKEEIMRMPEPQRNHAFAKKIEEDLRAKAEKAVSAFQIYFKDKQIHIKNKKIKKKFQKATNALVYTISLTPLDEANPNRQFCFIEPYQQGLKTIKTLLDEIEKNLSGQ
jgi:hypothetical protein